MYNKNGFAKGILITAVVTGGNAWAAGGLDLSLHANTSYNTNIDRVAFDGRDETTGGLGMALDYFAQRPRVAADIRANGTFYHYMKGTYDDEFLGALAGSLAFQIVPDRVTWLVQENYGPLLENPLEPDRPDNWAYDNYFTTGPDIIFGARTRTRFTTSLRYGRSDYESPQEPSSHYYLAELSVSRATGARSDVSLHLNGRKTSYEDMEILNDVLAGVRPDFHLYEAYVRAAGETRRGGLSLDAGATQIRQQGESKNTPLLRLRYNHRLSARTAIVASLGSQYAEPLERVQRLQGQTRDIDVARDDLAVLASPLQERYGDILLQMTGVRTTVNASARYSTIKYEIDDELSRQKYGDVALELQRNISPTFAASVRGLWTLRDFPTADRRDEDVRGSFILDWRTSRTISWQLLIEHVERSSNDPTAEYRTNIAAIELIYRPFVRDRSEGPTLFDRPAVR